MIMPVHTFNGAVTPGQGWFPCDGSIINEANYNAIHGAGSWAEYIGTSILDGKYSPSMNNKYLVGASSTAQDGSSAITSVGNSSHQVDLQHTHTTPNHNHRWYIPQGSSDDNIFDVNGTQRDISEASRTGLGIDVISGAGLSNSAATTSALYTGNEGAGTTGNGGSTTQSVQPESVQAVYYIRII
jgi:hypothetical protein